MKFTLIGTALMGLVLSGTAFAQGAEIFKGADGSAMYKPNPKGRDVT